MIEVDDTELEEDDREFLKRWAEALKVPLGVLILRIVEAAIEGATTRRLDLMLASPKFQLKILIDDELDLFD